MKYTLLIIATVSVLFNVFMCDKISRYENYYNATEDFLDTLENHYNWVDAFDYWPYYDAVENLGK